MEFNNVKIMKKANVYFEGKVTSRTIYFEDGTKKTLGFMMPGEYTFGTESEELMEVLGGEMDICLNEEEGFKTYATGDSFTVSKNSSFQVKVSAYADYCCSYSE